MNVNESERGTKEKETIRLGVSTGVGLRPFSCTLAPGAPPVSTLLATVCALPNGTLRLQFALEGRLEALRVPEAGEPPAGPLWQHTCFEAFVSAPEEEGYHEYNFSPAGHWAASAFLRYREAARPLKEENLALPVTSTRHTGHRTGRLTLCAEVPPVLLPASPVLRLGIAAVIEHRNGNLEYWALHHPVERPDFHHADGWTLQVEMQRGP